MLALLILSPAYTHTYRSRYDLNKQPGLTKKISISTISQEIYKTTSQFSKIYQNQPEKQATKKITCIQATLLDGKKLTLHISKLAMEVSVTLRKRLALDFGSDFENLS